MVDFTDRQMQAETERVDEFIQDKLKYQKQCMVSILIKMIVLFECHVNGK